MSRHRNKFIILRVTEQEHEALRVHARSASLSVCAYIRRCLALPIVKPGRKRQEKQDAPKP